LSLCKRSSTWAERREGRTNVFQKRKFDRVRFCEGGDPRVVTRLDDEEELMAATEGVVFMIDIGGG
jgi:hypothetical protein